MSIRNKNKNILKLMRCSKSISKATSEYYYSVLLLHLLCLPQKQKSLNFK